jgi:hypothetical protein
LVALVLRVSDQFYTNPAVVKFFDTPIVRIV